MRLSPEDRKRRQLRTLDALNLKRMGITDGMNHPEKRLRRNPGYTQFPTQQHVHERQQERWNDAEEATLP